MSIKRIDEIEDMIARGQMNAAQVFTQMKQLCQASCPEIPDSLEPGSRQALEGEAVGTARRCGYDRDITYCDFEADEVPIGTKLYTHPASADVREEKRKSFHRGQTELMAQFCLLINEMLEGDLKERCGLLEPWNSTHERLKTRLSSPEVPNEHGKNRYGLDMAYFRNLFNRELNRPLTDFRPDELARVLARAARTADPEVLGEAEFRTDERPTLGQRKAAQVGKAIGVLVQINDD